jgi:hypothetical protein
LPAFILSKKTGMGLSWRILLFVVIFLKVLHTDAQSTSQDSILYENAYTNALSAYNKQIGDQSPLYNGSIYNRYSFFVKTGSPYFLSENFGKGWVIYDNILFSNLSMLYEDLRKCVVYKRDSEEIQLINERISSFSIQGHHFIRLLPDSSQKNIGISDFYEILYDGPSEVLKNSIKTIQEIPTVDEGLTRYVREKDNYYIKVGPGFEPVRSKKDLLNIFQAHKKEIENFLKREKLKYGENTENVLIRTMGYYDQIVRSS